MVTTSGLTAPVGPDPLQLRDRTPIAIAAAADISTTGRSARTPRQSCALLSTHLFRSLTAAILLPSWT